MEAEQRIIPTYLKSKIPSTLSWPLGAQELSSALAGAPQFEELKISFDYYMSDKAGLRYWPWMELIKFEYVKHANSLSTSRRSIEKKDLERKWRICIAPVSRNDRKRMHDLLLLELPLAVTWLKKEQSREAVGRTSFRII
jgi:hypothetical protein